MAQCMNPHEMVFQQRMAQLRYMENEALRQREGVGWRLEMAQIGHQISSEEVSPYMLGASPSKPMPKKADKRLLLL